MKRFLFFFLIFCNGFLFADLGLPNIQAICKVELTNGEEVEGYIFLAKGGYDRFYKQHGFAFVKNNSVIHAYWFNLYLNSKIGIFKKKSDLEGRMYSLIAVRPWAYSLKADYHFIPDSLQFKVNVSNNREYLLNEKLEIYLELPECLHLEGVRGHDYRKVSINVNEIQELELQRRPNEKYLEEIRIKRKECWEKVLQKDSMQDYQEPLWYHEIYSDNNNREKMALHFLLIQY